MDYFCLLKCASAFMFFNLFHGKSSSAPGRKPVKCEYFFWTIIPAILYLPAMHRFSQGFRQRTKEKIPNHPKFLVVSGSEIVYEPQRFEAQTSFSCIQSVRFGSIYCAVLSRRHPLVAFLGKSQCNGSFEH